MRDRPFRESGNAAWIVLPAAAALAAALLTSRSAQPAMLAAGQARPVPAFTGGDADWLNSRPLAWEQLRGHVALLEFWTFACWNCERTIPWLQKLAPRYGARGLRLVGVHTPELPQEYDRGNVVRKLAELGVSWPVMLDNDYAYWKALHNRYWPAFYLVDKAGRLRASFAGETHEGDANASAIEAAIEALLLEK